MSRLAADHLSLMRGETRILDDISLDCAGGELLGVIGPNGAGKSSLLRLLAGLEPPTQGKVLFDDTPLARLGAQARARRLAYLAQSEQIAWPLEVETLVALGRLPHRAFLAPLSETDTAAIARALDKCDAAPFKGRAVTTLSAGERARVLLARALAVEAPVLLADEPIAALDPRHQLQVMTTLKAEAQRGAAVIVVLHDLSLAARFCDRLAVLERGHLRALGTPHDLLTGPLLGEVFGTRFHLGTHDGADFVLPWSLL